MKRLAVIGIGRMGGRHARNILKGVVKHAMLVAVCDTDKSVLDAFCAKYKVKGYTDRIEMLDKEKPDGVIIATPHYSHIEIAKDCANRNMDFLVEKPVSVTVKEAQELKDLLDKKPDVVGAMMLNQRTNRMYKKAKELIESGKIGPVKRVNFIVTDWYRSQYYYNMGGWRASWSGEGGGTLINQCVHQLDIWQWLLGMPSQIYAVCKTVGRDITTENDVTAIMSYEGFEGVFTASTHELPGTNRLEIAGENGKIVINKHKMIYYLNKYPEPTVNARAKRDYGNREDKKRKKYTYSYGLFRLIYDGINGQQARVLNNFVEVIATRDKSRLIADVNDGINGLTIINAINMSAWKGAQVKVPVDTQEYVKALNKKIAEEKSAIKKENTNA